MNSTTRRCTLLALLVVSMATVSCHQEPEADADADVDTDADADVDADGDTDADADADVDSDEDADADADSYADADADSYADADFEPVWPPYDRAPSWTSTDPGYATGAGFADIDGDGQLDLVVADGNDMEPGPVRVYFAAADGALPTSSSFQTDETAYHGHLATGDVNGDGWTDVVVAVFLGDDGEEPGGVALYLNDEGALPSSPTWESEERFYCFSLALGDVDLDGDLDLAAAVGEPYFHAPGPNLIFLNDGGGFEEPAAWQSGSARHSMDLAFFDADGDGWLDLAFANEGSAHTIYLNGGEAGGRLPATEPAWEAESGPFEGNTLDFGDVNGDGWLDLAVSDSNYWVGGRGTVSIFCGPDFERCWESADLPGYQSAVALADLDGDGDLDLAAGSWWSPVRLYRNQGGLETEPSFLSDTGGVIEAFAIHDLDRGGAVESTLPAAAGPLVPLPRPCEVVGWSPTVPAAVGDGYLTVPAGGPVEVTVRCSRTLDLLVTDWTPDHGNDLFRHR